MKLIDELPPSDPPTELESLPEPTPREIHRIQKKLTPSDTDASGYTRIYRESMDALTADASDSGGEFDQLNAELGIVSPVPVRRKQRQQQTSTGGVYGDGCEDSNSQSPSPRLHPATPLPPLNPDLNAEATVGLRTLRDVRIQTEAWISGIGPMEEWPRLFQEGFDEACEKHGKRTTQEEVDDYLKRVEKHALDRRAILRQLRSSPVIRPPPSHEAWGDYLAAGDMLEMLYRGVLILEVRMDILAPRGQIPADGDLSIRQ